MRIAMTILQWIATILIAVVLIFGAVVLIRWAAPRVALWTEWIWEASAVPVSAATTSSILDRENDTDIEGSGPIVEAINDLNDKVDNKFEELNTRIERVESGGVINSTRERTRLTDTSQANRRDEVVEDDADVATYDDARASGGGGGGDVEVDTYGYYTSNGGGTDGPFPVLFDGQSTGKEESDTYDLGVNPGQLGIVFGQYVEWNGNSVGDVEHGCGLVLIPEGWNGVFTVLDGRYEIYDLPKVDRDGWFVKLAEDRATEQAAHYGCPLKSFNEIPVWDSPMLSPIPYENGDNGTESSRSNDSTGSFADDNEEETNDSTSGRRNSGDEDNDQLRFSAGERVTGAYIVLDDGREYANCTLVAPTAGIVYGGFASPNEEADELAACN